MEEHIRETDGRQNKVLCLIEETGLFPLTGRPSLPFYLKEIWHRRHFILADARSRAFKSNRGMLLGNLWNLLNPLVDALTYGLVFGFILKTSRGIDNFVGYLVIGVIFFGILSKGLTSGGGLLQSSRAMIQAFRFPKASLVLGQSIRLFLDNFLPAVVAIVVALGFQHWHGISWTLLLIIPIYVLMHVFTCGLMFLVARASAIVPDVKAVVRVMNRIWFYTSGVFFSVERFASEPWLQTIMVANPAYKFLTALRDIVLTQSIPSARTWLELMLWSFGIVSIGFLYFWRAEAKYVNIK